MKQARIRVILLALCDAFFMVATFIAVAYLYRCFGGDYYLKYYLGLAPLLLIYLIVTVVRNYVEPRIVGTQLGLHPIITLVSMFIGLRLFGFWGLFGLPVGISFLWKQKNEKAAS